MTEDAQFPDKKKLENILIQTFGEPFEHEKQITIVEYSKGWWDILKKRTEHEEDKELDELFKCRPLENYIKSLLEKTAPLTCVRIPKMYDNFKALTQIGSLFNPLYEIKQKDLEMSYTKVSQILPAVRDVHLINIEYNKTFDALEQFIETLDNLKTKLAPYHNQALKIN